MSEAEVKKENVLVVQKSVSLDSKIPLALYHLSHDLRGPLNSMLGFTELLLEGIEGPLNDIQLEDISAIQQSAKKMLHMVNTLVDLSKLDANRISLGPVPVDLPDTIQAVIANEIQTDQLNFVLDSSNNIPPVLADQNRLTQILVNLFYFVITFKKQGLVNLTVASNSTHATLQITADEIHFSPNQLDGLFELAVNVDSTGHSELGKGGLELPLAYQLARAHEGDLSAESSPEKGTILYLSLPLAPPE